MGRWTTKACLPHSAGRSDFHKQMSQCFLVIKKESSIVPSGFLQIKRPEFRSLNMSRHVQLLPHISFILWGNASFWLVNKTSTVILRPLLNPLSCYQLETSQTDNLIFKGSVSACIWQKCLNNGVRFVPICKKIKGWWNFRFRLELVSWLKNLIFPIK